MKTTMNELFNELIKDNKKTAVSLPGRDLEAVAREMDKKLDKLIEQKEQPKAPEENATPEEPKAPEENAAPEEPKAPEENAAPEDPGKEDTE